MADTDTGDSDAPQPEQGGQVLTVIDGQCMRSLLKSCLLVIVLTGLFVAYLLVKPGGPARVTFVDNIIQGLLEGVGLILALPFFIQGIDRIRQSPPSFAERVATAKTSQRWLHLFHCLCTLCYFLRL